MGKSSLLLLLLCLSQITHAVELRISDDDLAMLPEYCTAKKKLPPGHPTRNHWERVIGPDFLHIHHLCNGIHQLNVYYTARSQDERQYALQGVANQVDYMKSHVSKSFPLWYELWMLDAKSLRFKKQYDDSLAAVAQALNYQKKDVRAMLLRADIYTEQQQFDLAIAELNQVKKLAPKLATVERRLKNIDKEQQAARATVN